MKSALLSLSVLFIFFGIVLGHERPRNLVNRNLCKRSGCVLTAEVTEGPYYFDTKFLRRNITEGYTGIPLNLNVTVMDIATCTLIENAAVDIWHANAAGIYSHFVSSENPAPVNSTFLRGIQLTDAMGTASFDTIFPGWYTGRAVHIHMKVQINGTATDEAFSGGSSVHTGQLFFNDTFTDEVYAADGAYTKAGSRTQLTSDGIWLGAGQTGYGLISFSMPTGSVAGGIAGTITVYVDKTAVGQGNTPGQGGSNQPPNGSNQTPNGSNQPPNGSNRPDNNATSAAVASSGVETMNEDGSMAAKTWMSAILVMMGVMVL